jgi:peptidoglycan hydrolase-like protein with peptidoglycan-binding domain
MKKKVVSSLLLSGAVFVMAPQAWSQTGGPSGSGSAGTGKSGETRAQKPSDSPMGGQQRSTPGSSSEMQSERGGISGQRTAGQQLSKDKVKEIQEALKDKGNDPGQIDGIMGPKTQQALRAFQKSENLQVTGRVDEKTASALGVDVDKAGAGSSVGSEKSSSGRSSSSGSSPSGLGSSSSGSGKSGSNNPDITEPKKGSTAGRQESTDGNPK